MQKSQQGLLQSLLLEILRQCPDITEEIHGLETHQRLEWLYNAQGQGQAGHLWTEKRLFFVFKRIKDKSLTASGLPVKFCFFIDGLDEYKTLEGGDHENTIVQILKTLLGDSSNIKLCVASRPWNAFERAFGGSPREEQTVRVHQYTKSDIEAFVGGNIVADARFSHSQYDETDLQSLVDEITEKAEGIFLWVDLVVREQLRGLENIDAVPDLRRRLRDIPPGLDEYFLDTFERIDTFYRQQTAQIFLLCICSHQALPAIAFRVFDRSKGGRKSLTNFDALQTALETPTTFTLSEQEEKSAARVLHMRLNGRCKDPLEVRKHNRFSNLPGYCVDFLHRSVSDFLRSDSMAGLLNSQAGEDFDGLFTCCCGLLISLKMNRYYESVPVTADADIMNFISSVEYVNTRPGMYGMCDDLLAHSAFKMSELDQERGSTTSDDEHKEGEPWVSSTWSGTLKPQDTDELTFLAVAIAYNLGSYVARCLEVKPSMIWSKKGRPLLAFALYSALIFDQASVSFSVSPLTVQALINAGASPNAIDPRSHGNPTVWDQYLRHLASPKSWDRRTQQAHFAVCKVLMKEGVPDRARLPSRTASDSAGYVSAAAVFESRFGKENALCLSDIHRENQPYQPYQPSQPNRTPEPSEAQPSPLQQWLRLSRQFVPGLRDGGSATTPSEATYRQT